jgi:hypothetical protein
MLCISSAIASYTVLEVHGVRQRPAISPAIFNIYMEAVMTNGKNLYKKNFLPAENFFSFAEKAE